MKDLEKLKGKADRSAADQIKFRKYQALQQLRSAQLGEKFKDFDRLIVETMNDLSIYEERFDQNFEQLWQPFSDSFSNRGRRGVSEMRRLKVFNEAANRLLSKKDNKIVKENNREWLKHLGKTLSGSGRVSDKHLAEAFGDIRALEAKELRIHIAASNFNKMMSATKSFVKHSAEVVGYFVFTTITWNLGKYAKAGLSWFMKGILPNRGDLVPVPTAAVCVYWVVSFVGGKTMELLNNYLNRTRVKKVKESRVDDNGCEVAFDSSVKDLGAEDWRACAESPKRSLAQTAGADA